MRTWFVIALVALTALAAGGGWRIGRTDIDTTIGTATAIAATSPAEAPRIGIAKFQFGPSTVTVPVGTTVTWVNQDDDAHTVTADDGRFSSAGLDHDEQFSYRFAAPGTYAYHCALHPHMTARIVVK